MRQLWENKMIVTSTKTVTIPLTQRQIEWFRHSTIRECCAVRQEVEIVPFLKLLLFNLLIGLMNFPELNLKQSF